MKIYSKLLQWFSSALIATVSWSTSLYPEPFPQWQPAIGPGQGYTVIYRAVLRENSLDTTRSAPFKIGMALPVAAQFPYQHLIRFISNPGTLLQFSEPDDSYVSVILPAPSPEISLRYTVVLHSADYRLSDIQTVFPYDIKSPLFKEFTAPDPKGLIDPLNLNTKKMALRSTDPNPIRFAQRILAWERSNLKYKTTGDYQTLDAIFQNKGGDCQALNAVFVSALRAHGIPSRLIVGQVINDQNTLDGHVWAEFYLERYGWIPVDVNYNYFGYTDGRRIAFHRSSTKLAISLGDGETCPIGGLQTIAYINSYGHRPTGTYKYQVTMKVESIGPDILE